MLSLGATLLIASTSVGRVAAADDHDYQFCNGYFALCAASTCTPTGKTITVNVTGGGTAIFPEAVCTCPIVSGVAIADVNAGNMQGSCEPPANGIWSLYTPKLHIPQAINEWVSTGRQALAPPLFCPKNLNLGAKLVNCASFACDSQTYINGVPVATCHCPIGESFAGTPVAPHTAFVTQAGQGDPEFCAEHPVSVPISLQ
jgi:hypothetical protein